MRIIPYYIVAGLTCIGALLAGVAIGSGADYIKQSAYNRAQANILISMDVATLTQVMVKDHKI